MSDNAPYELDVLQIAREIFPDDHGDPIAHDKFLRYVIWEYTGYPSFWTGDPRPCFRNQLIEYRDKGE